MITRWQAMGFTGAMEPPLYRCDARCSHPRASFLRSIIAQARIARPRERHTHFAEKRRPSAPGGLFRVGV